MEVEEVGDDGFRCRPAAGAAPRCAVRFPGSIHDLDCIPFAAQAAVEADLRYCFEGHLRVNVAGVVDGAGDVAESVARRVGFARLVRDTLAENFDIDRIGFGAEGVATRDAELACGITAARLMPVAQVSNRKLQVPLSTAATLTIERFATSSTTRHQFGVRFCS